jgi:hypothetical protein
LGTIPLELQAKEEDRWYRSAEFLGRGSAGLATPRDEDALFYNPANLPQPPETKPLGNAAVPGATKAEAKDSEENGEEGADKVPATGEASRWSFRKAVVLSPLVTLSETVSDYASVGSDDTKMLRALRDNVGKPVHAGVDNFTGALFGNLGVGVVSSVHGNFFAFRDPNNSGIETVDLHSNQNTGLVVGYGQNLAQSPLNVGVSGKVVKRTTTSAQISLANVSDIQDFKLSKYQNSGTGMGLDFGLIYALPDFAGARLAATVQDIGDTSFGSGKADGVAIDPLYQKVNVGASITPALPFGKTTLSLDLSDILQRADTNRLKSLHLGAEHVLADTLGLLAGINQGFSTWGVYLNSRYFRFDLGSYGQEIGERLGERSSRRYYLRLVSSF